MTALVVGAVAAPLVAFVINRQLADPSSRWFVGDLPNERSMHQRVVARTGGLGLLAGWLVALVVVALAAPEHQVDRTPVVALVPVGLLGGVSFVDDRRGVSARVRLLVHLFCSAAALTLLGLSWPWVVALTLPVGWAINLYNFMDGLDGLAGGAAVVGFGSYSVLSWAAGDLALAAPALLLATASLGFLALNWPPAQIFLGDAGSTTLGFTAAVIGITGSVRGVWPWWYPLAAFPMFFGDATATLVRRALRREVLWQAHRTHLYQRLCLGGMPRRRVMALYTGTAAVSASLAGVTLDSVLAPVTLAVPVLVGFVLQIRARNSGQP